MRSFSLFILNVMKLEIFLLQPTLHREPIIYRWLSTWADAATSPNQSRHVYAPSDKARELYLKYPGDRRYKVAMMIWWIKMVT